MPQPYRLRHFSRPTHLGTLHQIVAEKSETSSPKRLRHNTALKTVSIPNEYQQTVVSSAVKIRLIYNIKILPFIVSLLSSKGAEYHKSQSSDSCSRNWQASSKPRR